MAPEAGWAVPYVLSLQQVQLLRWRNRQQLLLGCTTCSESAAGAAVALEEGPAAVPGLFHMFYVCRRCSYCTERIFSNCS